KASLLPDKLVAVLKKNGNEKTVLFPFGISKELHTGPDPSLSADEQIKKDAAGDLIINEDLKWMTDFDVAIANGMGIRIPLSAQEYQTGFDTLKVVGIRFTSDAMQSKAELESTLQAHLQSHIGAGLIRQGTPTNNTESEASGYTWLDDPDESYSRLFKSSEAFPEEEEYALQSDGQKLAEALGIDSDLVRTMPNAHHFDQLESFAMNSALFPATLGYFMEEMMDPMFSDATIRQCKTFFTHFVSGRGPVPAIRIGRQPYGILPVSIYSSLHFNEESTRFTAMKGTSFRSQLYTVLKKMDEEWSNQVNKVAHIGQSGDPHQVLLNIIGLHAHSAEFHQRYAQTLKQLYNKLALEAGPIFGALIAAAFAQRGKTILKDLGLDENLKLPVLEKFFFGKANPLQGPLIDDVPDSETNPIRDYSASGKNYIEWLASESANTIRVENFGGNEAPVALLYILLRHALLLSQSDAATRLLISSELVRDKQAFFDPDFLHVEEQEKGKSKFEHLYSVQPAISGNKLMAEHIYEPAVLALRKETIRLNETLEALNILKNIPTARLERLLTEHIDCCSYRLDAWFTALVQSKLADMRKGADKKSKQGIYIGAYGWLQQVKPENKNLQPVNLQGSLQDVFHPDTSDPLMKDANNLGYIHAPSLNQAATAAILRNAFDSNKGSGAQNPFAINLTSDRVRIAEQFLEGIRNGQPLAALLGYHFERGLHDHHQLGPGEVDKFIYPLRKVFPLVLKKLEDSKTPAEESVEYLDAQNVVDGLKLIQHIQEHPGSTYPFGFPATALPPATATEANAINKQVKVIIDIHDAIGDLVLSEQVYQTVLGNFERASGNADAFSKGNYPPEIEISHTPRSGITLTHRMAIHLDPLATAPVGSAPRVTGEPAFFQWLTQLLPPPQKIACVVSYQSPVLAATTRLVTQSDLNLHAADLFQWLQPHSEQGMNEIDDRIYHYIRYTHCDHPDLQVSIRYTEIPDPADRSIVSFFELSALLQAVKKIGKGDRYLKPEHFSLAQAGEQVKGTWDIAQLTNRLQEVKAQLNIRTTELHTLLQSIQSIQSLQNDFRAELTPHVTDPSLLESIVLQTEKDIRQLLRQPDALAINACCDQLDETLSPVVNAATRSILKTFYSNVLQAYITDFSLFDTQLKDGSSLCQALHLFRDFQCGSGVWFQDIRAVYERVRTSCEILIGRWEEKMNSYDVQIALFNPAGDPTLQFALLQKAEAEISVEVHTELPPDLQVFKNTILDLQRTNFENKLNQIRSIKTAPQNTVLA
ncbi:MAG TPA: hypothetical protein PLP34_02990, partial [Chitinophagaceae bacterium]|nr:hypothetical protein [Chitinophagaceae bacterium]